MKLAERTLISGSNLRKWVETRKLGQTTHDLIQTNKSLNHVHLHDINGVLHNITSPYRVMLNKISILLNKTPTQNLVLPAAAISIGNTVFILCIWRYFTKKPMLTNSTKGALKAQWGKLSAKHQVLGIVFVSTRYTS